MLPFFIITGYIFVGITCMPLFAKILVYLDKRPALRRSDMPILYAWAMFWPIFLALFVIVTLVVVVATPIKWLGSKVNISGDAIYESLERVSRRNQ